MSWGFGTSLHWRLICGGKWILQLPARIPGQLLRHSLIEWIARLTSQELHFNKWELLGAVGISSLNKSLNLLQLLKPELCHFSAAEAKLALMRWFPEALGTQLPHRCKIELCRVVFPLGTKHLCTGLVTGVEISEECKHHPQRGCKNSSLLSFSPWKARQGSEELWVW